MDADRDNERVEQFHGEDPSLDSNNDEEQGQAYLNKENDQVEKDENGDPLTDKPYFKYVAPSKYMPTCPGDQRDYQIDWLGEDDPDKPTNWSEIKKLYTLVLCALSATVTAFGSAIVSTTSPSLMKKFHVGTSVAELVTTLYVLGFAAGPIIWGPMSEQTGRKIPQVIGIFGLTVFTFAGATAKDFQTIVITRFFAGALSSASLVTSPTVPADMYTSKFRGTAVSVVAMTICAGPMVAPVVGGYIVNSYLGWRWTFYILGIFSSLVLVLLVFFLSESYPPKVLTYRAQEIRMHTGNWAVSAPLENLELDTKGLIERTLLKPIRMLAVEPILLLLSLYHGFIYGILYLCLSAVPLIFTDYGWHGGNVYLPYLGMFTGTFLVVLTNIFVFETRYNKKCQQAGKPVLPEERLLLMILSGVLFCMGIFLLCWSGAYRAFWFVPTVGCALIGYGLIGIFMAIFNYIIDSYLMLAASAIAGNTFLRSGMGGAFPLFATQMFKNLGTQWAGTLLGCLAAILIPVPFLFYFFGKQIRQKSMYAVDLDALEVKLTRHSTRGSSSHP